MIRIVLIDVDNTLLDFDRCAAYAIETGMREVGLPYTEETYPAFREINERLWREIEKGNLKREGLTGIRWPWIFDRLGIRADGTAFEERFVRHLYDSHETVDGARELLEYLSGKYEVYAASNAPAGEQESRLTKAGLHPYLKGLFISQELGHPKPSREFFEACFRLLGEPPRDEVLLIGDSLTADMRGGVEFGIHTCWFNHDGRSHDIDLPVERIADRLEEIRSYY